MLKDKRHSKPTPPKEKPGWLRRGIASLAAFATLATGGLVAVSSANAIDNSGNGVIIGGGGSTGIGPNDFVLWLKDNLAQTAAGKPPTGWGTRDNANTSVLLNDLAEAGVDVSDSGVNKPLIQKACNQAVNRALDATHQRARVIGFATSLRGGFMWGDNAKHWKSLFEQRWSQAQAQPNGGVRFFLNGWTDGDVTKFARGEFDKGMAEMAAAGTVNNLAICVAVNESQPPMAFTPTISTEAPHIIQEGQPITDKVTVGVKSGDHWIDGTSVTAKGYYFTGSKDAIIRNLPYNGDPTDAGINNYLNQIRSAGGVRSYDVLGPQAVVESEEMEASGRGLLGVAEVVGDLVGVVTVHAALSGHVDDLAEPSEHRLASGPFDLAVQFVEGQVAHDPHGVVHGDPVVVAGGQGGAPPVGDVQELVERQRAGELVHQQHLLVPVAVEGMQVVADAVHVLGRVSVHHVGGLAHARLPVQVVDLDVAAAAGVVDRPVPCLDEPREPSDASGGVVVGVREQYLVKGHALFDHAAQLFEVVAFALLVRDVVGGQAVEERAGVICRYRRDRWFRRC